MPFVNPLLNIPIAPGVPPLPRDLTQPFPAPPPLLLADGPGIASLQFVPAPWGIFPNNGGFAVVTAESVVALSFKQDYLISDYPIEQGAFETYDKVQVPFEVRVRFVAGSSDAARAALLASIDAIIGDTKLYAVVTPEKTYTSVNVTHVDYRRTATDGVGLLQVDVWCVQVREGAVPQFSQTQQPSGAVAQSNGTVQGQAPTSQQQTAIKAALGEHSNGAVEETPTLAPTAPNPLVEETALFNQFP